jgi:hypothetical protein
MTGLAILLSTGRESVMPLIIAGSLLVWLGMLMFIAVIWRTGRQQ